VLKPNQTRNLPTRLVSLSGPTAEAKVPAPAKGESLQVLDIDQISTSSPRLRAAVKALAAEKAPETVSQLVLWQLTLEIDWPTMGELSRTWANPSELALAEQFVARLDRQDGRAQAGQSGTIYYEVTSADTGGERLTREVARLLTDRGLLGLSAVERMPSRPEGPAIACRIALAGGQATGQVWTTVGSGRSWQSAGKLSVVLTKRNAEQPAPAEVADACAQGLLSRLVRAELAKGPKANDKESFKIKIENASPLILSGLALAGNTNAEEAKPSALAGFSLPPRKVLTVPASREMVSRLGLKDGVRVVAATLSGL
jgi:hypothetical protein